LVALSPGTAELQLGVFLRSDGQVAELELGGPRGGLTTPRPEVLGFTNPVLAIAIEESADTEVGRDSAG
jgi:hypothetical protein